MTKMKLLILPILFALLTFPVLAVGKPENPGEQGRLKSCESRLTSITTRSDNLERMVANMIEKFEAITNRVIEFYETNVQPDVTVENYDDLIGDIDAKKEAVETALADAQAVMDDFTCDSDDVQGLLTQYRESMRIVKQALKEYRTSIRNLIVAVHTAVEESDEDSEE